MKPDFKICDVIIKLRHNTIYTYGYFFWILSTIKMKFGQILLCCMINISSMFLAECWRLGTSSRFFYDFIKMAIQQDPPIFNGWQIPFLIVFYSPFQKWNTRILIYLVIEYVAQASKLKKTWNLAPVLEIVRKITENYHPCLYLWIDQVWWLRELWF